MTSPTGEDATQFDPRDQDGFRSWTEIDVRFNDVDMFRHVNNTVFATYFEAGRLAINLADNAPPLPPGQSIVVARVSITYLGPVTWPGKLRLGTRVAQVGASSIVFLQSLFDGQACVAHCEAVSVCVDRSSGRSARFMPDRRMYLERFR